MGKLSRTTISSKWAKTRLLLRSNALKGYIPETVKWSRHDLKEMLNKHGMVYVKPNIGSCGIGVMRVKMKKKDEEESYKLHIRSQIRKYSTFEECYQAISQKVGSTDYLIQKGIRLHRHEGRKMDIRVMVQKNPQNKWETTGIIGRIGPRASAVTNISGGGAVVTLKRVLVDNEDKEKEIQKLSTLGLRIAKHMNKFYPNLKEIGVDVAWDDDLKPWILEVNTSPDPRLFNRLKDRSVIKRIVAYAKGYGRTMNLKSKFKFDLID